jgi:hypothetical protein
LVITSRERGQDALLPAFSVQGCTGQKIFTESVVLFWLVVQDHVEQAAVHRQPMAAA